MEISWFMRSYYFPKLIKKNNCIITVGKISIEHNFLSKYVSKGAIVMKFSPDVGNNPSNPDIQRNQTIDVT